MEKIIHFLASKGRLRVLIKMQNRINLMNRVNLRCNGVNESYSVKFNINNFKVIP